MLIATPMGYSHKADLGTPLGWAELITYLEAGRKGICPSMSPECYRFCLVHSGQMIFKNAIAARKWRTELLFEDPASFGEMMVKDIKSHLRWCDRHGMKPAFRFNGTSDFNWESFIFPNLGTTVHQFVYDLRPDAVINEYTKRYQVMLNWLAGQYLPNVYMTFSMHERNQKQAFSILEHGGNVAVVFRTKRGNDLPRTWASYPVLDGDRDDLRWLDAQRAEESSISRTHGRGLIIGLREKGTLVGKNSPFSIDPHLGDAVYWDEQYQEKAA